MPYASADLFLFPSLPETFGYVAPEAIASAAPLRWLPSTMRRPARLSFPT
jgi:glycosyltransferase involved in cell wall biosynthesis